MARGWNFGDIFGYGNATGDPDPIFGALTGQNAIKDATAAQQAALQKAFDAIQQYTGKAIDQQKPYTQHAAEDFNRQRGLVQSGYYQQPYGQSFAPQQYTPSGFTMNSSQGMASFHPQSFQMNSFTPQGLPPMPNLQAYQPPPQPQQQPQPVQQTPPMAPAQIIAQAVSKMMNRDTGPLSPLSGGWGPGSPAPIYNPQTGQNSPIPGKPADPRMPTIQDLITLMKNQSPGQSGPYGMQAPSMQGRGF